MENIINEIKNGHHPRFSEKDGRVVCECGSKCYWNKTEFKCHNLRCKHNKNKKYVRI